MPLCEHGRCYSESHKHINIVFAVVLNHKEKKNYVRNDTKKTPLWLDSHSHKAKPDCLPENRPKMCQVRKKCHDGVRLSATDRGRGCPSCLCGIPVTSQTAICAKPGVKTGLSLQQRGVICDEDTEVGSAGRMEFIPLLAEG